MKAFSRTFLIGLFLVGIVSLGGNHSCKLHGDACPMEDNTKAVTLSPGKKIDLGDGNALVYKFSKKPSLGTVILIVKVFDQNKQQITPYTITGASGMPSMGSAHDSGEVAFKLNQKMDYLLPVNVAMQGNWTVNIKIMKGAKEILKGVIPFHV